MRDNIVRLTSCALLLALSLSARAQQLKKISRIGFLSGSLSSAKSARTDAFRQRLRWWHYIYGATISPDALARADRVNR